MSSIRSLIVRIAPRAEVETVMDVGAHTGSDSLPIAREYADMRVFAVEPTPSLADRLREESRNLPNYRVIEAAIDLEDGERTFNLAGKGLAGVNSLNDYATDAERSVQGLPRVTERIDVRTRRLDSLCDELGIERIDVLHVDAQGSDLRVLASLGGRLAELKAGEMEVSNRVKLYASSVHRDEAWAFLRAQGFVVVDVDPVGWDRAEENLVFVRRSLGPGRVARAAPGVLFRTLVLRCYTRILVRRTEERLSRLRGRVALRTRGRRLVRRLR